MLSHYGKKNKQTYVGVAGEASVNN